MVLHKKIWKFPHSAVFKNRQLRGTNSLFVSFIFWPHSIQTLQSKFEFLESKNRKIPLNDNGKQSTPGISWNWHWQEINSLNETDTKWQPQYQMHYVCDLLICDVPQKYTQNMCSTYSICIINIKDLRDWFVTWGIVYMYLYSCEV